MKDSIYWDSIGRLWVICPHCGRKTPAWATHGMVHWRIAYTIAETVIPLLEGPKLQQTLEVIE